MNTSSYNIKNTLIICLGLVLFFSSCRDKSGLEKQIPKESSAVMVVNTKSLFTKIAIDQLGEVSIENLFGGSDTNRPPLDPNSDEAKWRDLMSDPSQLGVDLLADAYLVLGEAQNANPTYIAVMVHLSDVEKLKSYLENDPPSGLKGSVQELDGFSCIFLENEKSILAWNEKMATLLLSSNSKAPSLDDISRIYNLPSDHSIGQLSAFQNFQNGSRDIGLFMNLREWLANTPTHLLPKGIAQLPADYLGMQMNFSDGLISLRTSQYLPSQQENTYDEMLDEVKLSEIFQAFDMQEALGFANIRYSEEMVRKQVTANPLMQSQLTSLLTGIGLTENDFYSLFKGSAMIACTGMGMVQKEVTVLEMDEEFNMAEKKELKEVPSPKFVVALETDTERMKMVLDGLTKTLMVVADGDSYKVSFPGFENDGWRIWLKEGKCLATNEPNGFDMTYDNSSDLYSMAQQAPMSGYVNIDKTIQAMPLAFGREGAELREVLDYMQLMVNKPESGVINIDAELHLQNKDRNALLQLIAIAKEWKHREVKLPL